MAIGTNGQVLTSDGTDAAWATPSGGGSLPDTPAAVLLDAGNATTMLGLNGSGVGEALSASSARTRMELGGAALLAVGTTAGTVAAGDDSRIASARAAHDGRPRRRRSRAMRPREARRGALVGDPGVTSAEALNALLGSTVLAGAVREGWLWWKARVEKADAARAATEAARVAAAAANDAAKAAADGSVAGLLREQITAGEARAEKSAERAVAIAGALDASARATSELARAVDRIVPALDAIDDRIDMRMEQIDRRLALIEARITPPTGEHRAGVS